MLKQFNLLTHPALARRDAPYPKQGRSGLSLCTRWLGWSQLRAAFSPAHPLARRDVPSAWARAFRFTISLFRERPGCPLLGASSDHRFIVGALRARRAPVRSLLILL